MALQLILHNVSGEGNNCFYRAIFQALSRSKLLAEIDCDVLSEKDAIQCLRGKVAALVRTSTRASHVVNQLCNLARTGWIEPETIMAEYANLYPTSYLTDTLAVSLERFAEIIMTKQVMADSLDFEMMDHWLNKFGVSLFNVTCLNAVSSTNLLKLLTGEWNARQEFVILISTDNVHYNWVSFRYQIDTGKFNTEVVMNRQELVSLLASGPENPNVERISGGL